MYWSYIQPVDDDLLKLVVAKKCGSTRIDVVLDVYQENIIKNAEKGNRSAGQIQFNVIIGSAKISQWSTFLSNNKSKSQLIRFLVSNHICQSTETVVIHKPDTDVLLIAIAASGQIPSSLFIRTGTKTKRASYPLIK